MKQVFYITLILVLCYLGADVLIRGEEKAERPIVQLVAGASLIGMLVYNVYYLGKRPKLWKFFGFLKVWLFFVITGVAYFFFSLIGFPSEYASVNVRSAIILIYILTTIYFFYNATVNRHLVGKTLTMLIAVLMFNGITEVVIALNNREVKLGVEVVNTSAGYIFLMLLPILMHRYRKQNFWMFAMCLVLTLFSGKRGAVVVFVILIIYASKNFRKVFRNFKLDWRAIIFIGVLLLAGLYFVESAYDSLMHRMVNIENEKRGTVGSGRDVIWKTLLFFWADASLFNQIFGFGFYASPKIEGHVAHNDFVEYLIDLGLIGLTLWSYLLVRFYKNIKRLKKYDNYLYTLLLFCLTVFFGRGLFSGTNRTDSIVLSISLGYLLGVVYLKHIIPYLSNRLSKA
ncbi:O-antigen ligase family protein [Winogradskyella sp. J14-2]|uniref:O-antigen ligase family protein n=1 Tax=Winogradskyella sp. J14-2 TaxID=1936080 RepID=UPI0009F89749|nr:O-antigen ligase family protein [Winogradskyella sp. J14-2]